MNMCGRKVVGNGCNENDPSDLDSYRFGVPNKEFRLALARACFEESQHCPEHNDRHRPYRRTTENLATNCVL